MLTDGEKSQVHLAVASHKARNAKTMFIRATWLEALGGAEEMTDAERHQLSQLEPHARDSLTVEVPVKSVEKLLGE